MLACCLWWGCLPRFRRGISGGMRRDSSETAGFLQEKAVFRERNGAPGRRCGRAGQGAKMFRRAAGFRKRGHARIARRPKKQTARGATPAVRQYRAGTPKADRGGNAGFEITRTNQGRRRDKGPIRAAGLLRQDQSLMRTGMRTGTRRPCALVPGPPMTPANVAAHTHANNTARETTVKPATI